jgi:hypothetical protein
MVEYGSQPYMARGTEGWENLVRCDAMGAQFIGHRPIIELYNFTKLGLQAAGPLAVQSLGTGNAPAAVINSTIGAALHMDTTDAFNLIFKVPNDMDPAKGIDFRYNYSVAEATGSGKNVNFVTKISALTAGSAYAVGATAAGSDMAATLCAGSDKLEISPWCSYTDAVIAALGLKPGYDMISYLVTATLAVAANVDLWMIEMRYWRKQVG